MSEAEQADEKRPSAPLASGITVNPHSIQLSLNPPPLEAPDGFYGSGVEKSYDNDFPSLGGRG